MPQKHYAVGLAMLIFIIFALVFGLMYQNNNAFTILGTLAAVDSCETHCWAVMPAGCSYNVAVTLQWTYLNSTWREHNVTLGSERCNSCCYSFVNRTVFIEIVPEEPWLAVRFWFDDPKTLSQTYVALTTVCALLAFCSATILCAMACVGKDGGGGGGGSTRKSDTYLLRGH
jgi:hypothetical protein